MKGESQCDRAGRDGVNAEVEVSICILGDACFLNRVIVRLSQA